MDWDSDGKLDILSGCYWTEKEDGGHIQILRGAGELDFEEATALLSSAEKPLENVTLSEADPERGMADNQTKNICTQQHAVDYDGDGDLDLIVGCFASNFFFYENVGDEKENQLVEKPVELGLVSPDYHAAPHLVDFDGDGDLDFLTGGATGGAYISINEGTRDEPKYGDFKSLVKKPADPYQPQRLDSLVMGGGTRVWATDYNGDGLMDLLIGDNITISEPAKGVSEEEFAAKKAEHKRKSERLMKRYSELMNSGKEATNDFHRAFSDVHREMRESAKKFEHSDRTGYVWLLIQKPDTASAGEVTKN